MIDVGPVGDKIKQPDASWSPVIMSAVVYPGVGQWMQRRFNAFLVYSITFTIMSAIFASILFIYIRDLFPTIQMALEGQVAEPATIPPLMVIIKPFGVLLLIYVANVYDVIRGRSKVRRQLDQK